MKGNTDSINESMIGMQHVKVFESINIDGQHSYEEIQMTLDSFHGGRDWELLSRRPRKRWIQCCEASSGTVEAIINQARSCEASEKLWTLRHWLFASVVYTLSLYGWISHTCCIHVAFNTCLSFESYLCSICYMVHIFFLLYLSDSWTCRSSL
jgi:hypothetical protein